VILAVLLAASEIVGLPATSCAADLQLRFERADKRFAAGDILSLKSAVLGRHPETFALYRELQGDDYPLEATSLALFDYDGDGLDDVFLVYDQSIAFCGGDECLLEVFLRRRDGAWEFKVSDDIYDGLLMFVRTDDRGNLTYFETRPSDRHGFFADVFEERTLFLRRSTGPSYP
jgi:hypothetical protein